MQVKEKLTPFGMLKAFNLVMDKTTGNSKVPAYRHTFSVKAWSLQPQGCWYITSWLLALLVFSLPALPCPAPPFPALPCPVAIGKSLGPCSRHVVSAHVSLCSSPRSMAHGPFGSCCCRRYTMLLSAFRAMLSVSTSTWR